MEREKPDVRSIIYIMLIVLVGDICGLCVYYLDHTNKWQLLRPDQVALIMLVSVLLTIREIATIDFPEFGSNAYFKKCVECFLFALLTSLLVALRHG